MGALRKRWGIEKLEERVDDVMKAEANGNKSRVLVKAESAFSSDDEKGSAEDAVDEEEGDEDGGEDSSDGQADEMVDEDDLEDSDDVAQDSPTEGAETDSGISGLDNMEVGGGRSGAMKRSFRSTTRLQSLTSAGKTRTGGNGKRQISSPGSSGNGRAKRTKETDGRE